MNKRAVATSIACVLLCAASLAGEPVEPPPPVVMTPERLEDLLEQYGEIIDRGPNYWTVEYEQVRLNCVFNLKHDRMRIVTPIMPMSDLTAVQKDKMLIANYHTALDARYGINGGVLYSAFIHRLSTLNASDLEPAIRQVAVLALTFGTEYSSGELTYGARPDQEQPKEEEPDSNDLAT